MKAKFLTNVKENLKHNWISSEENIDTVEKG